MIQVIAYTQGNNTPIYLDTLKDETIQTTFRAQDIEDFTKRQGSFSQTFEMPFTNTNNHFFKHQYEIGVDSEDFNIYARTRVELQDNGLPIFSGYLQLLRVNLKSKTYSVNCVAEIANLSTELGERRLTDLDSSWLSGYDHALNAVNIRLSWGNVLVGCDLNIKDDLVYPYCDYGYGHQFNTQTTRDVLDPNTTNSNVVQDFQFRPWIKVKSLFDRILAEAGYSIDSNFMSLPQFEQVYFMLAGFETGIKSSSAPYPFQAGYTANQIITQPAAPITTYNTLLRLDRDSGNFASINYYDLGGNYDTTNFDFTAPKNGQHIFEGFWQVRINTPTRAPINIAFELYINGVASSQYLGFRTIDIVNPPANFFVSDTASLNLNAGDRVTVEAVYQAGLLGVDITINAISRWRLTGLPLNQAGERIELINNFPEMLQVDFVRSVVKQFNLFIEPSNENPKTLIIEPYPDYIDAGETLDWTEKLSFSKEVVIEPLTKFRKKVFNFEFDRDEDYLSAWRPNNGRSPLGSFKFETDDEFAEGEQSIDTVFAEIPYYRLFSTSAWTLRLYQNDNSVIAPMDLKPRIAYLNTQDSIVGLPAFYLFDNTQSLKTLEQDASFMSNFLIDDTSSNNPILDGSNVFDLNFGQGWTGDKGGMIAGVNNNCFELYWSRYLAEIYGNEARMLIAYFYLEPTDIHNLKFNSKIFVKDTYYRINKISNYTIGERNLTKVELIKIVSASRPFEDCDLVVDTLNQDGTVSFVDSEGNPVNVTRKCCEKYRFRYETVDGFDFGNCYWTETTSTTNPYEPTDPRPFKP